MSHEPVNNASTQYGKYIPVAMLDDVILALLEENTIMQKEQLVREAQEHLRIRLEWKRDEVYEGQIRKRIHYLNRHGLAATIRMSLPVELVGTKMIRSFRQFVMHGGAAVQVEGYNSKYMTMPDVLEKIGATGSRQRAITEYKVRSKKVREQRKLQDEQRDAIMKHVPI